jgi:hypothetical protein
VRGRRRSDEHGAEGITLKHARENRRNTDHEATQATQASSIGRRPFNPIDHEHLHRRAFFFRDYVTVEPRGW